MNNAETTRKLIASRISIARKQAGLSQAQVSKKLGIPRPSVSEIEAGRRRVAADELVRFADLYEVNVDWLAGRGATENNPAKDQIELAARNVAKLKQEDLDRVIALLSSLRPKKEE